MSPLDGLRVTLAGTFDPQMPRNRQLVRLLGRLGCTVTTWTTTPSRPGELDEPGARLLGPVLRDVTGTIVLAARLLGAVMLRRHPPHVVLVPHPSQGPAVLLGGLCRVLGVPVVVDFFVSLHETLVQDRGLVRPGGWRARTLRAIDAGAARQADVVLTDTEAGAALFAARTGTPTSRWAVVPIEADAALRVRPELPPVEPDTVLFVGSFIPLHGLEHIVRSALLLPPHVRLTLIGSGQQRPAVEALIEELQAPVALRDRVPPEELADHLARAAVCLGVFDDGPKAAHVLPYKVVEGLALGRPVITALTPATEPMREALALVPPADPSALAAAITALLADEAEAAALAARGRRWYEAHLSEPAVAPRLGAALELALQARTVAPPLTLMAGLRAPHIEALVRARAPAAILEVGAGEGAMGWRLARAARRYVGLEPDAAAHGVAAERLRGVAGASVRRGGLEALAADETFDLIAAFEVLEHLEDDVGALRTCRARLNPGGAVLLSVPAHRSLWGPADEAVGHHRRYDAEDLTRVLRAAGLTLLERRSYGAIGGHALELARHLLLGLRRQQVGEAREERSAGSGRLWQPHSRLAGLVTAVAAMPLRAAQAPFTRTRFGAGWIVLAGPET